MLNTIAGRQPPPPPAYARRTVFVFVDSFDLATLAALRYARSLRPTSLRAVHFVIDSARAEMLREQWIRADRGVVLDFVDVPDRRLVKAAADLVSEEVAIPGTHVTVILPRRSFSPLLGRLLHDRTADKIAGAVSRIPRSAATIIPFDVSSRVEVLQQRQAAAAAKTPIVPSPAASPHPDGQNGKQDTAKQDAAGQDTVQSRPVSRAGRGKTAKTARTRIACPPIWPTTDGPRRRPGSIRSAPSTSRAGSPSRAGCAAWRSARWSSNSVLAYEIADSTGELTALFYGRSRIPGVICGSRVRFRGSVGIRAGRPFMVNPTYELLASGPAEPADRRQSGDGGAKRLTSAGSGVRPRPASWRRQQLVGGVDHRRHAVRGCRTHRSAGSSRPARCRRCADGRRTARSARRWSRPP